jgi:hypothetical protein
MEDLMKRLQAAVTAVDARVFGVFGVFARMLHGLVSYALKLTDAASNIYCAI